MRILIDECLDERLRNLLPGHECQTARYAGMAGMKNGELLSAAEAAGFDVVLTVDQGIPRVAREGSRKVAIVVFRAKSNRLRDMRPLIAEALSKLRSIEPGQIVVVG